MTLYVVGTPIGNLDDLSPRALAILKTVPVLALEKWTDTSKLLHHFDLRPGVIVNYDDRRQKTAATKVLTWLEQGDVALVTSAGLPGISDPGAYLVEQARAAGFAVVPIPGPSALSVAMAVSGWTESVWFIGFLPRTRGKIVKLFEQAKALKANLACFESTHRLKKTLSLIAEKYPEVEIFVGKEMTKKFEDYSVALAADFLARMEVDHDFGRGEFTLIIHFGV